MREQFMQDAPIESTRERQAHRTQNCRHKVKDLRVWRFKAPLERCAVGVEHPLTVM